MREFWLAGLVALAVGGGDAGLPSYASPDPLSREALLFEPLENVFAVLDSGYFSEREDASPESLLFSDVMGVIPISTPSLSSR